MYFRPANGRSKNGRLPFVDTLERGRKRERERNRDTERDNIMLKRHQLPIKVKCEQSYR